MYEELLNQRGLSLERLHALIQLGEEGSLIRAARGDAGVQSRYSHYLQELSAYFGVALTERVGKTIRLTAAGEELVRIAREQFQRLVQFKNDAAGTSMSFRIGSAESLLQWLVVPAVGLLRRLGANPRFTLQNLRAEQIVARLQDQRLEFGLVSSDVPLGGLKSKPVCSVSHMIVVPDRISPRGGGLLTLKQALLECPHAAMAPASFVRQSINGIAENLGERFDPALECDSEAECAAAVQTGNFAAVLPLWAWDSSTSLPHSICEDPKLELLDQKLVLVWHPRSIQTRGAAAGEVEKSLRAKLTECASSANRDRI